MFQLCNRSRDRYVHYIHDTYIDIDIAIINYIDDEEPSVILAHADCEPVSLPKPPSSLIKSFSKIIM